MSASISQLLADHRRSECTEAAADNRCQAFEASSKFKSAAIAHRDIAKLLVPTFVKLVVVVSCGK